jgi:hypothetical protein
MLSCKAAHDLGIATPRLIRLSCSGKVRDRIDLMLSKLFEAST